MDSAIPCPRSSRVDGEADPSVRHLAIAFSERPNVAVHLSGCHVSVRIPPSDLPFSAISKLYVTASSGTASLDLPEFFRCGKHDLRSLNVVQFTCHAPWTSVGPGCTPIVGYSLLHYPLIYPLKVVRPRLTNASANFRFTPQTPFLSLSRMTDSGFNFRLRKCGRNVVSGGQASSLIGVNASFRVSTLLTCGWHYAKLSYPFAPGFKSLRIRSRWPG